MTIAEIRKIEAAVAKLEHLQNSLKNQRVTETIGEAKNTMLVALRKAEAAYLESHGHR
jgi:hypothetical protein